ncbi:MAG: PQQ-binding-like beta-propeller repeat protein [Kiritimatiellia bacterium]|nr:PQQ-binding-like beta-propeller repeat protein [Kiritimatiellia bacterium]
MKSTQHICLLTTRLTSALLVAGITISQRSSAAENAAEQSAEWPHWRGPDRNGISMETTWFGNKPDTKIREVWRASVGIGFSSMAVSSGRVYTMGQTAKNGRDKNQQEVVYCLAAGTGKLIWKKSYPCELLARNYDGGPHATPALEGGRAYTCSKLGQVFCFDAATGKVMWSTDLHKGLGYKPPIWGFAGSPTVIGEKVLLNVGSAAIALDKSNGKPIWRSQTEGAGYGTPLPFEAGGMKGIAFLAAKHFVMVDHETGKELWRIPWKTKFDINAADPVFSGDHMFVSSSYNTGCAVYKLQGGKGTQIWQSMAMKNQFNSSVLHQGHLYGFDGNVIGSAGTGGTLKCLEFMTGKEKWSAGGLGIGSLTLATGRLIVLSEKGELIIAQANPEKFDVLVRAQILQGKCWTVPVLAGGVIYARDAAGDLVCVDASR